METIEEFAAYLQEEQRQKMERDFPDSWDNVNKSAWQVSIVPGKKYTKVNIGSSGWFMVDADGNIYGIKGYGKVNKKKHYGTLDTIKKYWWGEYAPILKIRGL